MTVRSTCVAIVASTVATTVWPVGTALADELVAVVEPGVVTASGEALLPVRLARSGVSEPPRASDLAIEVDGIPLRGWEMVDPDSRGAESAVFVLVDPAGMSQRAAELWSRSLRAFLDRTEPGRTRALMVLDGRARLVSTDDLPGIDALTESLVESRSGPLWDGVVESIGELSRSPDLPIRRVLILITSGMESERSRHPAIACADAADSARVALYAVLPRVPESEDASAGAARLRQITRRTGGGLFGEARSREGEDAFADALAAASAVRILRLSGLDGPWPRSVSVRARPGSPTVSPGAIRPRRQVGARRAGVESWMSALFGALILCAAVGWLGYRFLPIGRLISVRGADVAPTTLTRAGATLGGARGNTLVFEHEGVSRNHAVIRVGRSGITLTDLGSTNGTRVNGEPVRGAVLGNGDRIELGGVVELRFEKIGFPFRRFR